MAPCISAPGIWRYPSSWNRTESLRRTWKHIRGKKINNYEKGSWVFGGFCLDFDPSCLHGAERSAFRGRTVRVARKGGRIWSWSSYRRVAAPRAPVATGSKSSVGVAAFAASQWPSTCDLCLKFEEVQSLGQKSEEDILQLQIAAALQYIPRPGKACTTLATGSDAKTGKEQIWNRHDWQQL